MVEVNIGADLTTQTADVEDGNMIILMCKRTLVQHHLWESRGYSRSSGHDFAIGRNFYQRRIWQLK